MTKLTITKIVKRMTSMKIKSNSILVNGYVIVRTNRTTWRIGEWAGDWLRSGSLEEIARRAVEPIAVLR